MNLYSKMLNGSGLGTSITDSSFCHANTPEDKLLWIGGLGRRMKMTASSPTHHHFLFWTASISGELSGPKRKPWYFLCPKEEASSCSCRFNSVTEKVSVVETRRTFGGSNLPTLVASQLNNRRLTGKSYLDLHLIIRSNKQEGEGQAPELLILSGPVMWKYMLRQPSIPTWEKCGRGN